MGTGVAESIPSLQFHHWSPCYFGLSLYCGGLFRFTFSVLKYAINNKYSLKPQFVFFPYLPQIHSLSVVSEPFRFMDTRSETHAEFRVEVNEALARHDTNFDELNHNFSRVSDALQGVMVELQVMRIAQSNRTLDREVNPFAAGDNLHDRPSASNTSNFDRNHTNLKLNFPTYVGEGEDPTRWIFKAKQYFEFQNIDAPQRVQLASFHLSKVSLQWYR